MILTVTLKKFPLLSEYYLHNHKLPALTNAKYLGVSLDSTLSFNRHIDAMSKKDNSILSFILRNLSKCHQKIKIDAYNSFVKPILSYAATVWSPHTEKYMNKLEAIQKRVAQFIVCDFRRTSSISGFLQNLQWKTIKAQHKELCILMLYKIIHKFVELPLPNYIIPAPHCTRKTVPNSFNQRH